MVLIPFLMVILGTPIVVYLLVPSEENVEKVIDTEYEQQNPNLN